MKIEAIIAIALAKVDAMVAALRMRTSAYLTKRLPESQAEFWRASEEFHHVCNEIEQADEPIKRMW
jgi:hypothetical protein